MTANFLPDLIAVSLDRLIVTRARRLNALLIVQYPHTFFVSKLLMFALLRTFSTLWQASIFSGEPCAVLIQALYASFSRLSSSGAGDDAQAVKPAVMLAMSKIFFIGRSSTARQTGSLPHLTSENSEWRNNNKFHVTLILEDVAVTTAPAWNIGVVVIFGEVQLEHGAFGTPLLQGINRIQTV